MITRIENLETLTELEELYLAENKLEKIENLQTLKKLKTLDISFNYLSKLENLEELTSLEELWVTHNKIHDFSDFEHIKELKSLKCIYFELCPVSKNPGYRQQVMDWAPQINQIDHFRRDMTYTFKGAGMKIKRQQPEEA